MSGRLARNLKGRVSMGSERSPDEEPPGTLETLPNDGRGASPRQAGRAQQRPIEDRIRDEHHDAHAKTIASAEFIERRRSRSDSQLRAEREEDRREWEARQRSEKSKRDDPTNTSQQ